MLSETPPAKAKSTSPRRSICSWIRPRYLRAGRADGVVGARDACINCNLTRGVVGHGAGIVMVRPKLGVVVELRDIIDPVLRFYIPMFGRAYVDADPALS